jgi:ABC-type Fe3+-hydroxamate transport system substrate-binding protein
MTNNHPRCSLFYILLLCALFLCACSAKTNAPVASNEPQPAEQPAERIVKDALGHEVKVPAHRHESALCGQRDLGVGKRELESDFIRETGGVGRG